MIRSSAQKSRKRGRPGPRPAADGPSLREAIVTAASRCIIERGHAALSTRAVAAAAGVNQSLIHYYFGTRERLMLAVLEQMNQALLKRQAEMFEAPTTFADKWAQACRFYKEDLASGYVRLLMELTALGAVNPTIETEMCKVRGQWRALLERVVADALDHFGIRSVPPEVVTTYLVAFWYGMEMEMVLGVSEEEGHYWSGLAAFERFLRWLEAEVRAGRRPTLA